MNNFKKVFTVSLTALLVVSGFFVFSDTTLAGSSDKITTVSVSDLTPDYILKSQSKVPLMTFTVESSDTSEHLKSVKVQYNGTDKDDVSKVYLFRESGGSGGIFDPAIDVEMASDISPSGGGEFTLNPSSDFAMSKNTNYQFYIAVDISGTAILSNTVDVKISKNKIVFDTGDWPNDTDKSLFDPAGSSVIKANQTITVTTHALASAIYNSTFPVVATASSGLAVAITTTGGCSGSGSGSATITMMSGTTSCVVHYNQAGNGSYNAATEVTEITNAAKANQTIIFGGLADKTYGDVDFGVSATASSSLTVTFGSQTPSVCTLSDTNVHIVAQGTCTVRASQAGDDNYNAAPDVDQSFSVAKKSLTVTVSASDKIYDATTDEPSFTLGVVGKVGSDDVSVTGGTALFDGVNVGPHTAVASGYSLAGAESNNYSISNPTASDSANITARDLTVIAATDSKVYDGNLTSAGIPTITSGALAAGDTVVWTQTFDDRNVGTGKVLTPAGSVNDGNAGNNYAVTFVPDLTGAITARPITVTADAKSKNYGDPDIALTYLITDGSLVGVDSFSGALSRVAGENVGTYTILQGTLTLNSNYSLSFIGANLVISQFVPTISVTVAAKSKTYGDADPELTYTYSPALYDGDTFSGSLIRVAGENVGDYAIEQGSLTAGSNYSLSFTGAYLTITPAAITVTANSQSKTYGDADPELTYSITSGALVGSDAFSGSLNRPEGGNVGAYAIGQGSLAAGGNYDLSFVGANLTITPRDLTITADNRTKIFGQTMTFAGTEFTTSELIEGDSATSATLTSAGTGASAAVGTYDIVPALAVGTGLGNYSISYVNGTLTVSAKATPIITWSDPADIVAGTALSDIQLNAAADVPGSFVYDPIAGTILSVGDGQTLATTFTPTDAVNYNSADASVMINVKPVTHAITASAGANGSIAPSETATVNDGADQAFTITPDSGYQVADVLVDGVSAGAITVYTFTNVTADHAISASFETIPPVISQEVPARTTPTYIIVTWATDHLATSRVIYDTVSHATLGAAPNYGYPNSTLETDTDPMVTSHAVTIPDLASGTTYYFRTVSHGSPETVSDEFTGTTASAPSAGGGGAGGGFASAMSLVIPAESVLSTSVQDTSAVISWTTSYAATSQVVYSAASEPHVFTYLDTLSFGYAHATSEDTNKVANHSVTITGLNPATVYYYRTVSRGSLAASDERSFVTTGVAGATTESQEGFGLGQENISNSGGLIAISALGPVENPEITPEITTEETPFVPVVSASPVAAATGQEFLANVSAFLSGNIGLIFILILMAGGIAYWILKGKKKKTF